MSVTKRYINAIGNKEDVFKNVAITEYTPKQIHTIEKLAAFVDAAILGNRCNTSARKAENKIAPNIIMKKIGTTNGHKANTPLTPIAAITTLMRNINNKAIRTLRDNTILNKNRFTIFPINHANPISNAMWP